jgi:hypothetical protein
VAAGRVFSLNVHAGYVCRHSGACCTAGWSIPVEPRIRALIGADWLTPDELGGCPQYDRPTGLCRIHAQHGESMLPDSCFQFPRRALVDDRGTFVSLSHFCPTAAGLLVDATGPLEIVSDPPAFPAMRKYEGLDARGEWPPLLRPNVLFDPDSYTRWEEHLVDVLGSPPMVDVENTLDRLARTAERLRCWTADDGPMIDWTERVLEHEHGGPAASFYAPYRSGAAYHLVTSAVPDGLAPPEWPVQAMDSDSILVAPHWSRAAPVVLRYLATKAFASWTAYQGRGVRTQIAELFLTASILRIECARACAAAHAPLDRERLLEAVRASDWLLMHLADRQALTTALTVVEENASTPLDR